MGIHVIPREIRLNTGIVTSSTTCVDLERRGGEGGADPLGKINFLNVNTLNYKNFFGSANALIVIHSFIFKNVNPN